MNRAFPPRRRLFRAPAILGALAPALLLGGCDWVVMAPSGDVAVQQRDLILISTLLMLLVILPVMVLTILFAWRFRAANRDADYRPDWDHSTGLELVIWAGPLLIIIALGALTWVSTHLLDPYRPLGRITPEQPIAGNLPIGRAAGGGQQAAPMDSVLEVQAVALDWKWLFIYPELGIATVNELAAPVNVPIRFRLTASSVMNAFFVPALAGQIYAMPGMETQLNAVINKPGDFEGFASNYNGAGFSGMRFRFRATDQAGFDRWVAAVRAAPGRLDRATYLRLERPSEKVPPIRFAAVDRGLYDRIVRMCVAPGRPCMAMAHAGHGTLPAVNNRPGPAGQGPRPEGALQREGAEKGTAPHSSAPQAPGGAGNAAPGSPANRNHTLNLLPALPGAPAPALG
ncbi:MAG: COX aromatic rich motif-containing protein [Sphingomonas fennica]